MIAALIARMLPGGEAERARLALFAAPILRNWNGIKVGALRAAGPLRSR
jgi:L-asparaginase II